MIRGLLGLVPVWLWAALLALALAAAAGSGWRAGVRHTLARIEVGRVEQAEQRRNQERRDAAMQRKIDDDLTEALVAGADLAHAADQRLRELSRAYRAAQPAAAQCGDDAPAAAVLRGADRSDLVALAREADDAVRALTACQQREVMRR